MFTISNHIAEIIAAFIFAGALWAMFRKRIGWKMCLVCFVIILWFAVFASYLSTQIVQVKEYVKITATGQKNEMATVNEICVLGTSINNKWYDLTYPVEGNWAWFPGNEGASYYYAGWFPGADGLQPDNATNYIVIEIMPGNNRFVTFLTNQWYGIAEVDFNGDVQQIDTYGNGEVKGIKIPDSGSEYYKLQAKKQRPFTLVILTALCITAFMLLHFFTASKRLEKIKKFKFLFEELVKRDFTLKYKRTSLGMLWSVLSPLMTFLIMWLVFRNILGSNIDHFAIYMFTGQIVFTFFSDATMQGMTSLLDNAGIFTKINVPKYFFLLSKNISSLINFGLTMLVLIIFIIADGLVITQIYLMLVYPICCLITFNIGVGLILSALYVFFRDMQYLWSVFTQLIMWISAIFYSVDAFGESMKKLFLFNPIYSFISYFRSIILAGEIPTVQTHLIIAFFSLTVLVLGGVIYKKFNHEFLYYV